jgi:cytochrome b6-f complex iron-sulfur subunit
MSRRDFFALAGWRLLWVAGGISLLGLLRFFFPRALYEPPTTFKAGFPDEFPADSVSEKYLKSHRTYIIRSEEGIYALSARCTHLGCTVIWSAGENKFKCPCHGSGFHTSGVNFEGPAPRALERQRVLLDREGQIVVDRGRIYREERGEWDDPDALLSV